jgi:hypothetical protein
MHRAIAILCGMALWMTVAGRAEGKTMSASYARHALSLKLPYAAERRGEAELIAQVLSPEDRVLGKTVRQEKAFSWRGFH